MTFKTMNLKDKKILVTGGAGFIGSHLTEKLFQEGANITVIDNLESGKKENLEKIDSQIKFVKGDIRDKNIIEELVQKNEIIFHFAANASVPRSVEEPEADFEANIIGTQNLLEAAKKYPVKKFLYASSAGVYGDSIYTPMDENHPTRPISPYGISKLTGEMYGLMYHKLYKVPFVSGRIFNTYGPRQPRFIMFDFLKKLKENPKILPIKGNGKQTRDYCFVEDTVNAFILLAEKDKTIGEVYNIASGHTISCEDLGLLMIKKLGIGAKIETKKNHRGWQGDAIYWVADPTKIKNLGFQPKFGLEEGLSKLISWFENKYGKIG